MFHANSIRFLSLLVGILVLVQAPARAALKTFDFSGTVTHEALFALFPSKVVGDSYSGSFTLDTDATLTSLSTPGDGAVATYVGNFGMTIEGASYAVSSARVQTRSLASDGIQLNFAVGANFGQLKLFGFGFFFAGDYSVPASLPPIAEFDHTAAVFAFNASNTFDIASITGLSGPTAIPAPGGLPLVALGLIAIAMVRGRWGRVCQGLSIERHREPAPVVKRGVPAAGCR
ncbi:MAG: hypothetical protein QF578_07795 [Alphaproteobacteria bacterium]|nr:hypothetical protein [Alphaproteobacteria bacterium]MDP6564710.1 hypothetical protein [Alphaproteobacteria bacterium]MDP6815213.1 hypothetical protein [Alphaproteobacteria bacterium]